MTALRQVVLEYRGRRLLDLQEQRISLVASLQQDDERARADAADAHDLASHVDDLELLEQVAPVVLQRGPVGAELLVDRMLQLISRETGGRLRSSSRAGTTMGGWLTIRYRPSTSSPSFDNACRLSRVRAFSTCFLADFSWPFVTASSFVAFFCDLSFFAETCLSMVASSVSSDRWAYQISIVDISANSAIVGGGRLARAGPRVPTEARDLGRRRSARHANCHAAIQVLLYGLLADLRPLAFAKTIAVTQAGA